MGRFARKRPPVEVIDPCDLPGKDGLILRYQCVKCGLKTRTEQVECPSCDGVCSCRPVRLPPHRAVIRVEQRTYERFGPNRLRGLSPEERSRERFADDGGGYDENRHEGDRENYDREERDPIDDRDSSRDRFDEENDPEEDDEDDEPAAEVVDIGKVETDNIPRIRTGWEQFDKIFVDGDHLEGGLPQPSVVTLASTPGCGKSRSMLELGGMLCQGGENIMIVAGEESAPQIKGRFNTMRIAKRFPRTLKRGAFKIVATGILEDILDAIDEHKPTVVFVDSIFMVFSRDIKGQPGKPAQLVHCTAHLYHRTHGTHEYEGLHKFTCILIVHGTKDNIEAGVQTMTHYIDVPLFAERVHQDGSPRPDQRTPVPGEDTFFRIFVTGKNRFGAQDPVAFFHMTKPFGVPVPHDPNAPILRPRPDRVAQRKQSPINSAKRMRCSKGSKKVRSSGAQST